MTKKQLEADLELYLSSEVVEGMVVYRLGIVRGSSLDLVLLQKRVYYPPHYHKNSEADFYIISGEGKIFLDDRELRYRAGNVFHIGKRVRHGFSPSEQTLFLSVQTPPIRDQITGEEDIHY